MKKTFQYICGVSSLVLILLPVLFPSPVSAQSTRPWEQIDAACVETTAGGAKVATIQGIGCVVVNTLNVGTMGVGLTAAFMMIVGFLLYGFSGGNPKGKEAGSKTITFSIAAVVLSICGVIFLNLIIKFTGVAPATLTQFNLKI